MTLSEFRHIRYRIQPHIRMTPIVPCEIPNLFLKLENLQYTHSFKIRGAFAHILDLMDAGDKRRILTVSAGNHGLAIARAAWTFEDSPDGARTRAKLTGHYWETLHIDLRMVDTADFVIAHCPTNIYSVGTVHEIALCRLERKPVLFVSPPVEFPSYDALRRHLSDDRVGMRLLENLRAELPIKPNPKGIPSLWYMPLVGGENFFDGFGFNESKFGKKLGWTETQLDRLEKRRPPKRPLLPALEQLNERLPEKWDNRLKKYVRNDDWLLWDIHDSKIEDAHG